MEKIDLSSADELRMLGILNEIRPFQYLSLSEKKEILSFSEVLRHQQGETIISEGEIDHSLFCVLEGTVQVMKNRDGKRIYLSSIGKGEIFGEAAIFVKVQRSADVVASDSVEVLRMPRDPLMRFFHLRGEAAIKFLMVMIFGLLQKLKEAHSELSFDRQSFLNQADVDSLLRSFHSEEK